MLEKLPFKVEVIQTDHGAEFGSQFHYHVLDRRIGHVYIQAGDPEAERQGRAVPPDRPGACVVQVRSRREHLELVRGPQRTERARQLDNTLRVPPTLVERLEQLAGDPLRLCCLRLRLLCHPQAHGSNSLPRIKKKGRTWQARPFSSFSSVFSF